MDSVVVTLHHRDIERERKKDSRWWEEDKSILKRLPNIYNYILKIQFLSYKNKTLQDMDIRAKVYDNS